MKFNIPVPLKSVLEYDYNRDGSDSIVRVYLGEVVIHEYAPSYVYDNEEELETKALNEVAEKLKRLLDTLD